MLTVTSPGSCSYYECRLISFVVKMPLNLLAYESDIRRDKTAVLLDLLKKLLVFFLNFFSKIHQRFINT